MPKTKRAFAAKKFSDVAMRYGIDTRPLEGIAAYYRGESPAPEQLDMIKFLLSARSEAESLFSADMLFTVEAETSQRVLFVGYEWFSLKVPGGYYTPDYSFLLADGRWVHVEVKASKHQAGYRDARSKLRAAASMNPWFVFYEAMKQPKNLGFSFEYIKPESDYVTMLLSTAST